MITRGVSIAKGVTTMKASICFCTILFIIATLFPAKISAQNQRFVVVSPRVGVVIDSLEAKTYGLFRHIKNFNSVSFYQAPDSTLWVVAQQKSPEGILDNSTFPISFELLNVYAEKIDHQEELMLGTYQMGTSQPHILYEDGTPVNPPPVTSKKTVISPPQVFTDFLPLAPNTSGLTRPIFETIRFDVSIGLMLSDLSGLNELSARSTKISFPGSFYVQVPITENPSILFIGGWSFAFVGDEGNIISFSSFILYRPGIFFSLKPIVGLGAGDTRYKYSGSIIINAHDRYPLLIFGMNIVYNTLDILCTYPLTKGVNTIFESKSYNIKPAGFALNLLLSL